jgi:hypothetical protein
MAIRSLVLVLVPAIGLIVSPVTGQTQEVKEKAVVEKKGEETPGVVHAEADRRLASAFAADSAVLGQPFRIWIADEKIAIAAKSLAVAKDNRLEAKELSLAFFSDRKENALAVKTVGTIPDAVLKLDRPITSLDELAKCKILAIEAAPADPGSDRTQMLRQKELLILQQLEAARETAARETAVRINIADGGVVTSGSTILKNVLAIDPRVGVQARYRFTIDANTPLRDLLPVPMKSAAALPHWTNEDLAKVPELAFGEPVAKTLTKDQALEATAHVLAKINHLNQKKTDGFMLAMLEQRTDLRGLPVRMGEECRTREDQARAFASAADTLRQAQQQVKNQNRGEDRFFTSQAVYNLAEHDQRATVAAMTQILMPESDTYRTGLARYLANIPHVDATKALARLVLFSPEDSVRNAAIDGLKTRRERDYADVLLQGFRYPLPAVSKRAAEALVKLERTDVVANLVDVLDRPDPRLPTRDKQGGKEVTVVREMVRVNHHRNCALCHAPGNTETTPEGALTIAVPLPTEALPKPSQGGYQNTPPLAPDIVVRIDTTYLRQDFSLMMPVADSHPWPEMQRFDFLVRTREVTPAEAQEFEPCCETPEPGRLSPYHRAALFALRELTGRDTEPTAAAWRKLLKLPSR